MVLVLLFVLVIVLVLVVVVVAAAVLVALVPLLWGYYSRHSFCCCGGCGLVGLLFSFFVVVGLAA